MKRPNGYWTKERCKEEALKYTLRKDFSEKSGSSYYRTRENGWLDELCSHMINNEKKPDGYWTKERCREEALKYNSRMGLKKSNQVVYNTIHKNGWVSDMFSHMNIQNIRYTKDICKQTALKYNRKIDFYKNNNTIYLAVKRNGWLDELCSHMVGNKPYGYWTYERCKEIASKYNKRSKFQIENAYAYKISRINGWLDDICSPMISINWTYDKCKLYASKCKNRKEFSTTYNRGYNISRQNGWLNEFFK
jgi:hypothetical protein